MAPHRQLWSARPMFSSLTSFQCSTYTCSAQQRASAQICTSWFLQTCWGGRHVLLLGDPAQLLAVSRTDIFGTTLWRQFSVLQQATVPLPTTKIRTTQALPKATPTHLTNYQESSPIIICTLPLTALILITYLLKTWLKWTLYPQLFHF